MVIDHHRHPTFPEPRHHPPRATPTYGARCVRGEFEDGVYLRGVFDVDSVFGEITGAFFDPPVWFFGFSLVS